ncbi:MAG: hypothetical protein ABR616_10910 [Dermatophilaceae bacterium]|nr:hypothetical protein [Intrasporangiaceae bacterium]
MDGEGNPAQTSGEERPAQPAPNHQVDPAAFNKGFKEQQQAGQQPTPGQTQNPATGRTFTEQEVEAIRQQEKDKLYGRVEEVQNELKAMREEREAEQRIRAEEEAHAVKAAEEKAEADMDVRELIRKKEEEWTSQMNEMRSEAQKAQALLDQERRFSALQEYKRGKLETHADDIMPHLHSYVQGNSEEEIDASIQQQIETTNAILTDIQAAQQQQAASVPTTRVTAPGDAGPMEQATSSSRTFTDQDIANMTPGEYAKHRDQLLRAAGNVGPYAR